MRKHPSRALLSVFNLFLFCGVVGLLETSPAWGRSPGQDSLDAGNVLYQQEQYEEALAAFKRATDLDPGLLRAWENVGWAYIRLNNIGEALRTWEMLLKIDPKNVFLLNEIGLIHMKAKDWTKAIAAFHRSLQAEPNQPKSLLRLGECYQSLDRPEEAAKQYEAALKLQPGDGEIIRRRAAMYEAMNQGSKALALLEKAVSRDATLSSALAPSLGRLHAQRGDRLFSEKDYVQAETAYRTALRWNPSHALSWANLGWSRRQQGDLPSAIEMWRKALSVEPHRRQLYVPIADALVELGKISEAHSWYTLAWQSGRREPGIPYHLAELAFHEKNLPLASQWLTTLFALPDFGEKWPFRVANLTINHNQPEMGISLLKNRITLGSKDEGDHKALSRLYIFQGNTAFKEGLFEQAVERYREALQHDPENTAAFRDLGWSYWRTGQWAACEETWKRYRSLSPDQPAPHNLLTQLYLFRKAYPEAIASITTSLELSPDQPDQKLKRAKAFFWNAQYVKAKEEGEALAAAYPDHLPIQIFWGDMLMRYHDFRKSLKQWRKILNAGSDIPRARASWIVSLYELGRYDTALQEAKKIVDAGDPQEAILKFLVNDALTREDMEEIIHGYQLLTKHFPQRPAYWLKLAAYQEQMEHFSDVHETLRQAREYHPNHLSIHLAFLEDERRHGDPESAYREYNALALKYPNNRSVYLGNLYASIAKRRHQETLNQLEKNQLTFLKAYEVDLIKEQAYTAMGDSPKAASFLRQISMPEENRHYVPILLYHGIGSHARSHEALPLDLFESQVKALKEAGYHFITVRDLDQMITGKKPFPEKPLVLTFDDARIDSFQLGDQILAKYNIPATMFVPTARMIDGHPAFADWNMIRMYASTGRWDLQSHGHSAHDPILIDATEQSTGFLVNRKWLEEEERLEREDEFITRLEEDYQESIQKLNDNVQGLNIVGYAFPFSEAGQESAGSEPRAAEWNEQFLKKYFRFGFVQDMTGYNAIDVTPTPPPMMLRRFSVPLLWDGPKLVKHLALQHPRWLATEKIGQTYYWNGQYKKARLIFNQQAAEEPLLKGDTEYFLAEISYQEGRFKEAQEHLTRAIAESSERATKNVRLQNNVRWANHTQVQTQFNLARDSKDRTHQWETIQLRHPGTRFPVDLLAEIGQFSFRESGLPDVSGQEIALGSRWSSLSPITLDGKVRARFVPDGTHTENIWLYGKYGGEAQVMSLRWSYEDVETLLAHEAQLQSQNYDARYRVRFAPRWEGQGALAYRDYEDGNRRTDIKIGMQYKLLSPHWQIGVMAIRSNSLFDAKEYYTPAELNSGRGVITYRRFFERGGSVEGYAEAGVTKDPFLGVRPVLYGSIESVYDWSEQIRSGFELGYSQSPGYHNGTAAVNLHYLF